MNEMCAPLRRAARPLQGPAAVRLSRCELLHVTPPLATALEEAPLPGHPFKQEATRTGDAQASGSLVVILISRARQPLLSFVTIRWSRIETRGHERERGARPMTRQ